MNNETKIGVLVVTVLIACRAHLENGEVQLYSRRV